MKRETIITFKNVLALRLPDVIDPTDFIEVSGGRQEFVFVVKDFRHKRSTQKEAVISLTFDNAKLLHRHLGKMLKAN